MAEHNRPGASGTDYERVVTEPVPWQPDDTPLRRTPDELLPGGATGAAARRLGWQVRAWREAHGISQQALASRLGMAQPNVARLEGGGVGPTLTTLALLAERLGVRVTVAPGRDAVEIVVEDALPAA
jgi:ribosome-binding protein aMBF1 (putative translation factor)